MNVNELRTILDNQQMKLETVKEQVAFSNSEITILDDYTILDVIYNPEEADIRLRIKTKEKLKDENKQN